MTLHNLQVPVTVNEVYNHQKTKGRAEKVPFQYVDKAQRKHALETFTWLL